MEGSQLLAGVECEGNLIGVCGVCDGNPTTAAKELSIGGSRSTVEATIVACIIWMVSLIRHKDSIADSSITDTNERISIRSWWVTKVDFNVDCNVLFWDLSSLEYRYSQESSTSSPHLEVHDCISSRHKSTDSSMILYPLWGHQLVVEERSFTWCALNMLENIVYMTSQDNTEICIMWYRYNVVAC